MDPLCSSHVLLVYLFTLLSYFHVGSFPQMPCGPGDIKSETFETHLILPTSSLVLGVILPHLGHCYSLLVFFADCPSPCPPALPINPPQEGWLLSNANLMVLFPLLTSLKGSLSPLGGEGHPWQACRPHVLKLPTSAAPALHQPDLIPSSSSPTQAGIEGSPLTGIRGASCKMKLIAWK